MPWGFKPLANACRTAGCGKFAKQWEEEGAGYRQPLLRTAREISDDLVVLNC